MTTSGVYDSDETVADIVTDALREIGMLEQGDVLSSSDMALGVRRLRLMLRTWAASDGIRLHLHGVQTVSLSAATATYTLSPRALDVKSAMVRVGGADTPVRVISIQEYEALTNKDAEGVPFLVWPDRQDTQTQVTVYPVPTASMSLRLVVDRPVEDVTAQTETVEWPPEWVETIMMNLAVRLAPAFGVDVPRAFPLLIAQAQDMKEDLCAQQREGSVFFGVTT